MRADLQIKQASEKEVVERRRFEGTGEHMDFFQNNFYRNGFVIKEASIIPHGTRKFAALPPSPWLAAS